MAQPKEIDLMDRTIDEWPDDIKENPKNAKHCKNCRHYCAYVYEFDHIENSDSLVSDYGECRRFPPKLVAAEESGFPVVEENLWCGEFDF